MSALGKSGLDFLNGDPVNFGEILKDSFCPDANDDEVRNLGDDLLRKAGLDLQSPFDCFTGAIVGTMTQKEMIELITKPNKDDATLRMFMESIKVSCPDMYDIVNNPSKASNFLNSVGDLIPEEIRDSLQEASSYDDGLPIYNSICLTSAELDRWNQLRRARLEGNGLNSQDARDQVDMFNQRSQDALADALDSLNNGPEKNLNDLMKDLLDPLKDLLEGCELEDGESNYGNSVIKEPKELVKVQDELSDSIFDDIIDTASKELSKTTFLFGKGSLISQIMSDTQGNHKDLHVFYSNIFITGLNYHDAEADDAKKLEAASFIEKLFDSSDNSGYYPETIGSLCKTQMEAEAQYSSNVQVFPEEIITKNNPNLDIEYDLVVKEEIEDTSFKKVFSRNIDKIIGSYEIGGSVGFVSRDLVDVKNSLDYKIKFESDYFNYNFTSTQKVDSDEFFTNFESDGSVEIRNTVFNNFIKSKLTSLEYSPNLTDSLNYNEFMTLCFNGIAKSVLDITEGFDFGFMEEEILEDDLRYVNPEAGSEEYTYGESEKVLGRSYTNHPRVTFLNPEQYGGTYQVPPVYIKPKKMKGWMEYSKNMFPTEEECSPKSENILAPSAIKKQINDSRNSIPYDEKLKDLTEDCFYDKPFAKVLTKNALSGIEGVLKVSLRFMVIQEFIRSIPIASALEINEDNYDMSNAEFIAQKLIKNLKSVNPFGPRRVEKENYYLLFLEQCVQTFQRNVMDKLPKKFNKETAAEEIDYSSVGMEIKEAYDVINSYKDAFDYYTPSEPKEKTISLLKDRSLDPVLLSHEDFHVYSGAFQKLGEKIFNSNSDYKYKPDFLQGQRVTNIYAVLFTIKICEEQCLKILRRMIVDEYKSVTKEFLKGNPAIIKDLNKFLLTNKDIFLENQVVNFGLQTYEDKISIGSFESMGSVHEVVDTEILSPFTENVTKMKLERYIRVEEKTNYEISPEALEIMNSRSHNLRGVVAVQELQTFFEDNIEVLGEYYISDLFGNAELEEPPEDAAENFNPTMIGKIGLSSGLRMVVNLPKKTHNLEQISINDLELSKIEKTYYCNHQNFTSEEIDFVIPLAHSEVEIIEKKIKDLNVIAEYDLDCLARKIVENKEYVDLFEKICPVKASASILLNYCNMFFISSIGGSTDGWESDKVLKDKSGDASQTDLKCRNYFASFYNSNSYFSFEFSGIPKIQFPDFFKLLFAGFEFPEFNLKLVVPNPFKFDHKIIKTNPYNKNEELCEE